MPSITHVLETALYCDDLRPALDFYRNILGLRVLVSSERFAALDAGTATVLLLFQRGSTTSAADTPGGRIPPHEATGPAHFAFAIPTVDVGAWEAHLGAHGVAIESRVEWPAGGRSLYFRDPDGHSVELATPRTWPTY